MILLIDNYDSFVFNLARYLAELGYDTEVIRNDATTLDEIVKISPTHIILSPGPCTPNEAGICLDLIDFFLDKKPILGVCLGHQAIAQACGGRVIKAKYPKHGKAENILHSKQGIFRNIPNPLRVGRYHSLIVDNLSLPSTLVVTAKTKEDEIMAIQHRDFPVFGVQFHPESILTDCGHTLIHDFLNLE